MKINFKKIINIKNKDDLKKFSLEKPIFHDNYLFHYLIQVDNLQGLKLHKFPVYLENNDGLNGFHLAAKENNLKILAYLIDNYPDYIYNKNIIKETFVDYMVIDEIPSFISKYKNLNWYDLINKKLAKKITSNLQYNKLKKFIIFYRNNEETIFSIVQNNLISQQQKIKLLDKYTNDEINIKNKLGEGIILDAINKNEEILFNYLLDRNVDVNYYTLFNNDNPLIYALSMDITNNMFKYSKKILEKITITNPTFYRDIDKFANNIAHYLIYFRMLRNKQLIVPKQINYEPDFAIFSLLDNYSWNQNNIRKQTPINIITKLDYDIYNKLFIKNKVQVSKNVLESIQNTELDNNKKKWIKLFNNLTNYFEAQDDINIDIDKYSHATLFQAKFTDVAVYVLYLIDNYKNLLIPNMCSATEVTNSNYLINNLTFQDTFPFTDNLIVKEPIFPWIISYYSENEYYIHPYLNNIINSSRNKRFGSVFMGIFINEIFHANIIVYDFKNRTIERFEPYGNTNLVDNTLDDLLEEELTWNTGFKYLRPNDFLPYAGFQTISDENNIKNQKQGDFGGFCLAWCLWYLETKLINPDIDSKILVEKLINKISKLDIKFSEFIRNYGNKINEKRVKYLEKIDIKATDSSNVVLSANNDIKLTNYLIKKFKCL
jgi:hypothetical protein